MFSKPFTAPLLRPLLVVLALLVAAPAFASADRVVDTAEIHAVLADQANDDSDTREALRGLLDRESTRELAATHDIDLRRAEDALSTATDAELETLAPWVASLDDGEMAGGDRIVISATTLIIILLLLILIAD